MKNAPTHIQKKLPSMYHQFKELAGVDITAEAMEVGPTTHYVMGGVRVDGETQMSTVPGLFAAGEVAAGLHGANRLGGNSLSDLLVFGKLAGEHAAKFASDNPSASVDKGQVEAAIADSLAPFDRKGENPYNIQHDLQDMMQDKVGIVRTNDDIASAVEEITAFSKRASNASVMGHREYNPGWHTALDLANLLMISEAIALSALDRKESRGAHFREDFPDKDEAYAKHNTIVRKGSNGEMQVIRQPIPQMPQKLADIIKEMG